MCHFVGTKWVTAEERGQNKVYNDIPKHPQNKKKHQNKENK